MRSSVIASVVIVLLSLVWGSQSITKAAEISSYKTESDKTIVQGCQGCSACEQSSENMSLPFRAFPFILVALTVAVLLVVKKNKMKWLFWTVGLTLLMAVLRMLAGPKPDPTNVACPSVKADSIESITKINQNQPVDSGSAEEVFLPIEDADQFLPFDETDGKNSSIEKAAVKTGRWSTGDKNILIRTLIALLATLLAGWIFRFRTGRSFRSSILLGSLVYFGFYTGGCPCMISSFQNLLLFLMGESVRWINLIWILGLFLLTYFFGRIWCGWICHLGALQEFLYHPVRKLNSLSPDVRKTFRVIRIVAILVLMIQLLITKTNLFITIDPFKVAFNMRSANLVGWILMAILLISSLLVYRPFCQAFCPVGLVMEWIARLPGASFLQTNKQCKSCNQCQKACPSEVISKNTSGVLINNQACIRCGQCIDQCRIAGIGYKKGLEKTINNN